MKKIIKIGIPIFILIIVYIVMLFGIDSIINTYIYTIIKIKTYK